MILKMLLMLVGVGVTALGGMVWVFALGTASVRYELHLTLRDAAGLPLRPLTKYSIPNTIIPGATNGWATLTPTVG